MKKKVLRFCLFFFILIVLIEVVSFIFIPNKDNLLQFGYYNKSKYSILSEPNDTIDVIFLGDSLTYNGISPMYIWKNYGYTSYDCALPATTMDDLYKYSELIIESQHPNLVIFESDPLFRNPHNIRKYKFKIKDSKKVFPVFIFHNNWKQLTKSEWVEPFKGFKYSSRVDGPKETPILKKSKKKKEIYEENLEYFDKIVKLFKDNNIEIIIAELPNVAYGKKKHNAIKALAEDYDLELLTIEADDFGLDWFKDTKDKGVHMNYNGALKLSDYMGKYIESKNIVKDHRNEKEYASWDKAYKLYTVQVLEQQNK